MSLQRPLQSLADDELLSRLAHLLRASRRAEAPLVAHIAEVDARHLYARFACTSMHKYCTDILHLSDSEAYYRIAVARAGLEHPVLLQMLAEGRLHLSSISLLAPHLTPENRDAVLARAVRKSKRGIEELVAELAPRPDVPSVMRKLPEESAVPIRSAVLELPCLELGPVEEAALRPGPVPAEIPIFRPDVVGEETLRRELVSTGVSTEAPPRRVSSPPRAFQPLSPARYKVQFTAGAELRAKLERLQALLRSEVSDGDPGRVVERATLPGA